MHTPNTEALKSAVRSVPFRVAVFASAAISLGSLAMNYTDSRPTVGYTNICFKPTNVKILSKAAKQGKHYCTASQRYWISDPILSDWERTEPEFYGKLTRLKSIPPQNQNKWIYGATTVLGGLVVAGLGASRLNLINKLAPGYRKEIQAQWHRDAVRNGVQMASDAIDGRMAVLGKQYRGEIDLARSQSAYLTPDEIYAQIQQAELMQAQEQAYLQGQQEAETVQPQQGQLPGQSMQDIANPSDKVNACDSHPTIKPALIQTLESSAIAPILKAGVLKVIGGQGSGKTTLVNGGLLRYRLHQGHKLIVINSHKSFDMYTGLEPHLEVGTEFYATGSSDPERAKSLVNGMQKILSVLEVRYTEYQNKPIGSYNHYPITILIEECGEWAGLLGEKGLPLIQAFWQKMFIACRKAKLFPIITAQDDTMAMFGNPKGLAELIKSSGAVTLTLFAKPDSNSPDGWSPTGKGLINIPNQDAQKIDVPDIRSLVDNPDVFTDLNPPRPQQSTSPSTQSNDRLNIARSLIVDCWNAESVEPNSEVKLSDNAQLVLEIVQASTKPTILFNAIRSSRKWGDKPVSVEVVREAINELLKAGKITGDDDEGYAPVK
jgi:hypothetical protein